MGKAMQAHTRLGAHLESVISRSHIMGFLCTRAKLDM
jgi:hypothetical protein